jgi:hypothetical protein
MKSNKGMKLFGNKSPPKPLRLSKDTKSLVKTAIGVGIGLWALKQIKS